MVLWTLTSSNFYRLIFYWRKFATEPYIRDALVAVLQFSLNFYVRDILIGVLMYTKRTRSTPLIGKKGNICFLKHTPVTVKKRNDTFLTHKAKLKITVCPYVCSVCYVYLLIFIEWQAYLPFQRIGKKKKFLSVLSLYSLYTYILLENTILYHLPTRVVMWNIQL